MKFLSFTCQLLSDNVENATDEVIDAAILVLSEELKEIVREKRRKHGHKCRNWIGLGESLGASNCLFHELSSEDPQEYRKHEDGCRKIPLVDGKLYM